MNKKVKRIIRFFTITTIIASLISFAFGAWFGWALCRRKTNKMIATTSQTAATVSTTKEKPKYIVLDVIATAYCPCDECSEG